MTGLAVVIYASGYGGAEKAAKLDPQNLALSLLLMADRPSAVLNVAWTLKYIMFTYVLFGFAILDAAIGATLLLVWQVGIALHVYASFGGSQWDVLFLRPIGFEFGIGMLCAFLSRVRVGDNIWSNVGLLVCGSTGFIGAKLAESYVFHHDLAESLAVWVFGGCSAALVIGLTKLDLGGHIRLPRFVSTLGKASYAVYLVNYSSIVMMTAAMRAFGLRIGGNNFIAVIVVGIAVGCGLLFDLFLDQPIQRVLAKLK
jgi:peptidoglycan/LPS O-acetylase OafA/YrhL